MTNQANSPSKRSDQQSNKKQHQQRSGGRQSENEKFGNRQPGGEFDRDKQQPEKSGKR